MNDPITQIHRFVERTLGEAGSHGMDHTERVFHLCRIIGAAEGADMESLLPAALLHDIARPIEKQKGLPHEIEGARIAESFLASIGYDSARIPLIAAAIRTHRFQSDHSPESLEAKILSDADKIDAMGAMGIARTFLRAGEHGGGVEDAISHFHEKLLLLQDRMYTQTGRTIAHERHAILITFLSALEHEQGRSNEYTGYKKPD